MSTPSHVREQTLAQHNVRPRLTHAWIATLCGLFSAVGYMAANICLRQVADLDPVWVSQMKTIPLFVVTGPLLVWRLARSQALMPSWQLWALIAGSAAVGQLGGNVLFQWSLGEVGLALAVPITMGAQIVAGAALGRWLRDDPMSPSMIVAAALLTAAIIVLSCGAQDAHAAIAGRPAARPWHVAAGVVAACVSGIAYSCLSAAVRYTGQRGLPTATLLFTSGTVGFVLLGSLVSYRQGTQPWQTTRWPDFAVLLGAGIFNLIAFTALTKALQLSSVVFVNVLSASQIALAALAGVILFREAFTQPMAWGVALTVLGLLSIRPRDPSTRRNDTSAPTEDGTLRPRAAPTLDQPPAPHGLACSDSATAAK